MTTTTISSANNKPWDDPSQIDLFLDLSEIKMSLRGDSLDAIVRRLETTLAPFESARIQSCGPRAFALVDGIANFEVGLEQARDDIKKCQQVLVALRRFPLLKNLELHIHGWPLPCAELALLSGQNNLQQLTISGGQLEGSSSVLSAAFRGHTSLASLSLEGLPGMKWNHLLLNLTRTCPNLRDLSLKFAESMEGGSDLSDSTLEELFASNQLKMLHLLNVPFLSSAGFYGIFQALEDNTSLVDLSFHTNSEWKIEAGGVEAVGEMLQENETLQFLSVSVEDTEALPIVQALQSNRTLQGLQLLIGNWVRSATLIRAWEAMLKDNYVLRQVDVTGRTWNGNASARKVDFFLRLNCLGRYHLIKSGKATQEDWLKVIIDQKEDVQIVQYLLSKNPPLCQVPRETKKLCFCCLL